MESSDCRERAAGEPGVSEVGRVLRQVAGEGRIDSFEPVLLTAHGGDLNGFVMIKGDAGKLAELLEDDAFLDLVMEAGYCVEGIGVVPGYIGEGLTDVLSRWLKLIGE